MTASINISRQGHNSRTNAASISLFVRKKFPAFVESRRENRRRREYFCSKRTRFASAICSRLERLTKRVRYSDPASQDFASLSFFSLIPQRIIRGIRRSSFSLVFRCSVFRDRDNSDLFYLRDLTGSLHATLVQNCPKKNCENESTNLRPARKINSGVG